MKAYNKNQKNFRGVFAEIPLNSGQERVLITHIINIVGGYYLSPSGYQNSSSRKKDDIKPKYVAMFLATYSTNSLTIQSVGDLFGVSHSNIIHACKKITDYLLYDKELQVEIEELKNRIQKSFIEVVNNRQTAYDMNGITYINLNECVSIKMGEKHLLGVNLTSHDIDCLKMMFGEVSVKSHKNTGLFLLDKKQIRHEASRTEA
jgi:hypothetical protein